MRLTGTDRMIFEHHFPATERSWYSIQTSEQGFQYYYSVKDKKRDINVYFSFLVRYQKIILTWRETFATSVNQFNNIVILSAVCESEVDPIW